MTISSSSKIYLPLILPILIFVSLLAVRPAAAASAAQAVFVHMDTTTQGNWQGVYGSDGYFVANTTTNKTPPYAVFTPQNQGNWTWATSGTDIRDLQVPSSTSTTARQASCWYTPAGYDLDVNITDGSTHQFAVYALDWDSNGRSETIQAVDGTSGTVLDTRTVSNFAKGIYYVWNVSGHVKFNVTLIGGDNAVVSGAFFDVAPSASVPGIAHFVAVDSTTQGNWRGVYGADGYNVAGDSLATPSYASLTLQNQINWTWLPSTTDLRALQTGNGLGRIAATWYNIPTFSMDVNITDGNTHRFALYAVDWDSHARAETVEVRDAATNSLLDSENISGFANGLYLVWNVSGHVKFSVTLNAGVNAVISGAFFGGAVGSSTPTNPALSITKTHTGSFTQGQQSAAYTATVSNALNAAPTSGVVTVTETVPSGLVLVSMAGTGWTCPASGSTCTRSDALNAGSSYPPITVRVNVAANASSPQVNQVSVSGGGSTAANASDSTVVAVFSSSVSTVHFVQKDTVTSGNWQTAYGADGYSIPNVTPASIPTYATFTSQNGTNYTWVASTSDARALLVPGSTSQRTATTWFNLPAFSFDVNFTDGQTHMFALYALDWDNRGRTETIDVRDATSNVLLDSESASVFGNGLYLVWNITGHVKINVTSTAGPNAVISGVFFGGAASPGSGTTPPPTGGQGFLSVNPASFNFGSVNIGSSVAQTFAVSNTGTATVTISNVTLVGASLSAVGVSNGVILSPGQSASLNVTYAPAAAIPLSGSITFASNASDPSLVLALTGTGLPAPLPTHNAITFLGTDTTTQGAWKGIGNFNSPPANSSLVYGKDGDVLPDTESCDACNPFPAYASFGPGLVNSATPGNLGTMPYRTHASAALVQGSSGVMGAEPENASNTNYFQCNYTYSNAAAPWAPMVAWRPAVDTREISTWYTCAGVTSFYLELSFGATTHNFEVYVVDDANGGTARRSEELQVLDGDTDVVLYDSGSFTNFTGGVYYKWSITGHVKIKVINTSSNGTNAVINGVFFN